MSSRSDFPRLMPVRVLPQLWSLWFATVFASEIIYLQCLPHFLYQADCLSLYATLSCSLQVFATFLFVYLCTWQTICHCSSGPDDIISSSIFFKSSIQRRSIFQYVTNKRRKIHSSLNLYIYKWNPIRIYQFVLLFVSY